MADNHLYTRAVCEEWAGNPLYNPLAKKKFRLTVGKGVYNKLEKKCKKLHNIGVRLSEEEKKPVQAKEKRKKPFVITSEQCKQLQKNPSINPLTGRKIDPSVLHGIYKKLVKECEELQKEIQDMAKATEPPYLSLEKRTEKLQKLRLRNALRKALRPILHNRDSLENRIHFAKVIRKYNEMTHQCIQSSVDNKNKLVLMGEKNQKPIEKIYFDKQIGSASVYGTAYMNAGKGLARLLKFSIKVMGNKFSNEVSLLKRMSMLAETEISPNMPITYDVLHCKTANKDALLTQASGVPDLVKKGKYYVVLNELANGDLHDWFKYKYTAREYESVILQILFALRTFHRYTKFYHNDTHLGNFLYHKVEAGGFWNYRYKTDSGQVIDIFVPNTGYLVVLWDPGLARRLQDYSQINKDVLRPLTLIHTMNTIQMYKDKQMKPVPEAMFTPFERILNYIRSFPDNDTMMEYIADRKNKYFKHIYFDKSQLPANAVILNKYAYVL